MAIVLLHLPEKLCDATILFGLERFISGFFSHTIAGFTCCLELL